MRNCLGVDNQTVQYALDRAFRFCSLKLLDPIAITHAYLRNRQPRTGGSRYLSSRTLVSMGIWKSFVDNVSSRLAFFPPQPATYAVKEHSDNRELYIDPSTPGIRRVPCEVVRLQSKRSKTASDELVAAFVPCPGHTQKAPVLLFSHGNAVDLGQMLPFLRELAKELKYNIVGYDYTGYGCSTGTPSVSATIADIDAVFNWLVQVKKRRPQDIVLYGQSVGSGPTVDLAARVPDLAGVVLHSPLLSGMRVLNPGWKRWPGWADVYPNHRLVAQVEAPLLVMHGTEDEVVDFSHGKALHAAAKNPMDPLWAEGFNHQDLETCSRYVPHLQRFLDKAFSNAAGR